jgi:adenine-specific DNA-methyltransferase
MKVCRLQEDGTGRPARNATGGGIMKKLAMKSADLTQANIDKIAALFPNVITETRDGQGNLMRVVDFERLKQELSGQLIEGEKERYQMTWPGKRQAVLNANTPTDKTLRPVRADSADWDNTRNLYIEGDNLEALKLLRESYLNKIRLIYIDPPYNTGNDFIYRDDFRQDAAAYLEASGQIGEDGARLVPNPSSGGRFHSDWLTMMYSRLKVARNLLRDDGVIFISIDDHELDNLLKLLEEIFGRANHIATFSWVKKKKGSHLSRTVRSMTEYVVAYAKNIEAIELYGEDAYSDKWQPLAKRTNAHKVLQFRGGVVETPLGDGTYAKGKYGEGSSAVAFLDDFTVSAGRIVSDFAVSGPFVWTQAKLDAELALGTRVALSSKFGFNVLRSDQESKVKRPPTLLDHRLEIGTNEDAYAEAIELFGEERVMDYPKPVSLIQYLIRTVGYYDKEMTVLDFFSGSATTAHAVMALNAEDGGNRRFIMVQLPEEVGEASGAWRAGFRTICDIGKERIRRAARKIREETGADIDYGFRVFRVDSSNMKDVYYAPDRLGQRDLLDLASNIKEDRTGEDLLVQVMLELGLELSLPMKTKLIEGKTVHYVAENSLIACFDDDLPESVIREIAKEQPLRAVFRDSSFADDSARINVEELFKMLSPGTDVRVL